VTGAIVQVAAAVIRRADGQVLLAQRPPGKVYAGYWEFPGGKLEPGETPRHALDRELAEELGLRVRRAAPWLTQRFVYPHAHVELNFFRVLDWDGEPHGHDGQAFAWQLPGAFTVSPLLPANTLVLRALQLPELYGISNASDVGEDAFIERARRALDRGLSLIQLREKEWPLGRQRDLAERLLALAQRYDARVLLNGDAATARDWGFHGVHWTSSVLANATERPDDLVCAASCHTRSDIARAGALGLDFVVLGPVMPTPAHGDATPLGWNGFATTVERAPLPVFALGGLTRDHLDVAVDHGAHGVALRRAAWINQPSPSERGSSPGTR
jgi:8-oxo-dGTP diphosphatase